MMQDTNEDVIGEENEPKGYTDEELQWATEVAYLNVPREDKLYG